MKTAKRYLDLLQNLLPGRVYRRSDLIALFPTVEVDKSLKHLVGNEHFQKVGPGLYYYVKQSQYGPLPPDENELLDNFLQTTDFLVVSNNMYNKLGLGLTQLSTDVRVYNTKRYEKITLVGKEYQFTRPNAGYPKNITTEFLLVDLFNNSKSVGEDVTLLKEKVKKKVDSFDKRKLLKLAEQYGKVGTKNYFMELLVERLSTPPTRLTKRVSRHYRKELLDERLHSLPERKRIVSGDNKRNAA